MFEESLISSSHLRQVRTGERTLAMFKVRLPWYRSLPLSCLDDATLSIDAERVPLDRISFRLYGTTYRFQELRQFPDVLWFVLDAAELLVDLPRPLADGSHSLSLSLFVRIPYHRGSNFRQISACSKSLLAKSRVSP